MELIRCRRCGFAEELKEVSALYDNWYKEVGEFQAVDAAAFEVVKVHSSWVPDSYLMEKMERSLCNMEIVYSKASEMLKEEQKVCYGRMYSIYLPAAGVVLEGIIGVATIAVMVRNVFLARAAGGDVQVIRSENLTTLTYVDGFSASGDKVAILCFNIVMWVMRDFLYKRAKDSTKVISLLKDITSDEKGSLFINEGLLRLKMWKERAESKDTLQEVLPIPDVLISMISSSTLFDEERGLFLGKKFKVWVEIAFKVGFFVLIFVDIYMDSMEKSNQLLKATLLTFFVSLFIISRLNDYSFLSKIGSFATNAQFS